ncbi:hypothetical protein [Hugenholtzia roseola]|nr:hypothetical protein [Hugenholtzia roseola]
MKKIRSHASKWVLFLLFLWFGSLVSSCIHSPKQPWTPKYKSYKQSKKKK